jgi:hypothetical protein
VATLLSFYILKQLIFNKSCIPFENPTLHEIHDIILNGTTVTFTSEGCDMQTRLVLSGNYTDGKTPQKVI